MSIEYGKIVRDGADGNESLVDDIEREAWVRFVAVLMPAACEFELQDGDRPDGCAAQVASRFADDLMTEFRTRFIDDRRKPRENGAYEQFHSER